METNASSGAICHPCGAEYSAKMHDFISSEQNTDFDWSRKVDAPQVVWRDAASQIRITDLLDIIKLSVTAAKDRIHSVCIIENISCSLIDLLQTVWGLDTKFFAEHATNPNKEELWRKLDDPAVYQEAKRYSHLDGIFEYHGIETSQQETLNSSPNTSPQHCFKDSASLIESTAFYPYQPYLAVDYKNQP
jgi:hypothetical protein